MIPSSQPEPPPGRQTVRILIEAADAGTASLLEAAVDNLRISRQQHHQETNAESAGRNEQVHHKDTKDTKDGSETPADSDRRRGLSAVAGAAERWGGLDVCPLALRLSRASVARCAAALQRSARRSSRGPVSLTASSSRPPRPSWP